jgi:subtilisin family serine protease
MGLFEWVMKGLGKNGTRLSPLQQPQIPSFERLESRVLLSADVSLAADFQPLQTFEEQVISVDLEPGRIEEVGGQTTGDRSETHESELSLLSGVARAEGLDYIPGRIILGLTSETNIQEAITMVESLGGSVTKDLSSINALVVELPDPDLDMAEAISQWMSQPGVQYAQPDYVRNVNAVFPNDGYFSDQWVLHNTGQTGGTPDADIDAPEAWDRFTGGSDVVLASIDTGVNYSHPDLNMWINPGEIAGNGIDDDGNGYVDDIHGIDAYNGDSDPRDDHIFRHGTAVSGVMAAVGNNDIGISGVNWNARLMALKFQNRFGVGQTSTAIECIEYMTMMKRDYGVNVVVANTSWGANTPDPALLAAIEVAINEGIMFVAAAGNDSRDVDSAAPFYPASYDLDGIIAVAATDHNDQLAYFSNWGADSVDLAAPGESILSVDLFLEDGTSMAAPHVAGAVAFLRAFSPGSSLAQIKAAILAGTDMIPALNGITVSGGRLNLKGALMSLQTEVTVSVVPTSVAEDGADMLDFVFSRSGDTGAPLTVNFNVAGSATFSSDYTQIGTASFAASSGTVIIPAGSPTATATIDPTADATVESDETIVLAVATGTGYIVGSINSAIGTIQNDDLATISINDVLLAEGNTGITAFSFTVSTNNPASHDITVVTNTNSTTAVGGGTDYTDLVSHTATISAGTTSTTVAVDVTGELVVEPDETFVVNLTDARFNGATDLTRVTLGEVQGIGTIINEDTATLTLSQVSTTQNEGTGGTTAAFGFSVTLDNPVQGGLDLAYMTNDNTATAADNDYVDNDSTVIFSGTAGETGTITVLVNHDAKVEADELFKVALGAVSGLAAGVDVNDITTTGTPQIGMIINDDTATLTIANEAKSETSAYLRFNVTLSHDVQGGLTVQKQTSDGTATLADGDFRYMLGTLSFSGYAGETHGFSVRIRPDSKVEADETFIVSLKNVQTLSAGVNASNIDASDTAVCTILNDDTAALTVTDMTQAEDKGPVPFTVMLSHAVQGGLTVDYQTTDASATVGDNDYDAVTGTLNFSGVAGESHTFTVDVIADGQVEFDEVFTVSLSNVQPLGAGVDTADIDATDTAQGIVIRDDGHDLTNLVSIAEVQVIYDHKSGQKTVDILVMNHSMQTLYGRLQLIVEVEDIDRSFVSLANPDDLTFDGQSYVSLDSPAGDRRMDPGELVRVRLVFDNGARSFFDFSLSLRGMLADQAPSADTEAPQASVDLLRTNDPTPALTGRADDAQAIIDVWVEGRWYKTINHGNGIWRTLDVIHPALTPGSYDVLVRATDPTGNTSEASFVNTLIILAPEPPIIEVDDPATLFVVELAHDYQTGQLHVSVLPENRSGRIITGPMPLVVEEIDSPTASLVNPDGLTEDGKAYVDMTQDLPGDQLGPGELIRVELVFENALGSAFGSRLSTRGALAADSPVTPTTPPAMTIQSLPEVPIPVVPAPIVTSSLLVSEIEPEPLDDLIEIHVLQQQYNHQSGQVTVGALVSNRSGRIIRGPLQLTVKQVSSPFIGLAHASGQTSSGLDYLDLSGYLDDLRFRSGQSFFDSATFNNAACCHFKFELDIRGFLDSDDDWLLH